MRFQIFPLDRPVCGEAVHGLQARVFLGESIAHAAPVQRGAAHRHRSGNDAPGRLVRDEVAGPLVLAVLQAALAIVEAVLEVEQLLSGFDDDDGPGGAQLRQLLRDHRGGNASADDYRICFVSHVT